MSRNHCTTLVLQPTRLLAFMMLLSLPLLSAGQVSSNESAPIGVQAPEIDPVPPPRVVPEGTLKAGDIPLRDFLRYLHVATGRLVNFPSDDPTFADDLRIRVLSNIDRFTIPVAEAILALNGYRITERELQDGNRVYELAAAHSREGNKLPRTGPVVTRGPDLEKIADKQVGTLVYPLEHTDPGEVVGILRDLLDVDAKSGIKVISIPTSRTVIVKAPARVLRHLIVLLRYIDVEALQEPRLLRVYELEHADSRDMVDLLAQVLDEFSGRSLRSPSRRTSSPRDRTGAGTSSPAPARPRRATTPAGADSEITSIVPDPRTHKLIVQSSSASEVDLIESLIEQLDVKYTGDRRYTRVYAVKYHRASNMAETLQAWMQGSGLDQRFRIVAHDPTNTIIIRSVDQRYGGVLNRLFELDAPHSIVSSETVVAEFEIRSVPLLEADPQLVLAKLQETWKKDPAVRIRLHAPSRTLILRAPPTTVEAVVASVRALDR